MTIESGDRVSKNGISVAASRDSAGVPKEFQNKGLTGENTIPQDMRGQEAAFKSAEEFPNASDAVHEMQDSAYLAGKRLFDVVSASMGLVVLSPVLLAAAIAVKATSKGPILFKQLRFGKDKRPFVCYKFRSMTVDAPDNVPTSDMNENPAVMTPIGEFIRKTSIDELPQLINIVKGDMSVIGPRPMILQEVDQIAERDRYDANSIKPGLTGWAQVNGRDLVNVDEKARLDGDYRKNMGFAIDAVCFLKSVEVVLKGKGNKASSGNDANGDNPSAAGSICEPVVPTVMKKKGKLLVVSQHYWPEPFNFADICESLVEEGYDVTVLTGIPNYPEGEIYEEYLGGKRRYELRNGVRIIRSSLIPRHQDVIHRIANYFSFSANAKKLIIGLERVFDAVIAFQTSPVMMAEPALEYGRRNNVPVLLWCIDIWPECLTAGGIKRGTPPYEMFREISKSIYSRADRLAVTSPLFIEYMRKNLDIHREDTVYLPQYAEDIFAHVVKPYTDGFDPERINLTFAGNVGSAQSVETIIHAANLLKNDQRFLFHIVGSGSSESHCKQISEDFGLNNVIFHGRHSIESMPAFYAASDAMVATFADNPVLGYTLPRKVQSYLASGKPVLGTLVGEARRVIENAACGLCCDPDDAVGLAAICLVFAEQDDHVRAALGRNAKAYYESHYTKRLFLNTLEQTLEEMKGTRNVQ